MCRRGSPRTGAHANRTLTGGAPRARGSPGARPASEGNLALTRPRIRVITAAATDVGRRRSGNEDSYASWAAENDAAAHAGDHLLVVCDGMGGSNAGEVASRMAADTVVREFTAAPPTDTAQALSHAIQVANQEIWEHSRSQQDLNGMGTTCTAVALKGDQVMVAHVGDSRAYLVRAHRARQITSDHSLVAQLVARNQLSPEEARSDPRRNVVTRSVGVGPEIEVDVVSVGEPLKSGDTLVVCSDGLHGQMSDDEIAGFAMGESLPEACSDLIELANARGGPDNITVAMMRVERDAAPAGNPIGRWLRSLTGRGDA
ncbi:MAG TPA: Stp1/IreP family PP2C-type Ser/Thr phosphatase [Verrucomicrobiae bacterium]|nr:Stp1/IreP family PP2C-type Ser/Thr phosphatase [Verrucomicrobiae bacterium]